LIERLELNRKQRKQHLERMDGSLNPKKIYNFKLEERRNVGRTKSRWKDQVEPNGERKGPTGSYLDDDDDSWINKFSIISRLI
jgi:hypothetical protein